MTAPEKLEKARVFLASLEEDEHMPMYIQANICQFRCEILDDWHED